MNNPITPEDAAKQICRLVDAYIADDAPVYPVKEAAEIIQSQRQQAINPYRDLIKAAVEHERRWNNPGQLSQESSCGCWVCKAVKALDPERTFTAGVLEDNHTLTATLGIAVGALEEIAGQGCYGDYDGFCRDYESEKDMWCNQCKAGAALSPEDIKAVEG